jgi:hypothetical protein
MIIDIDNETSVLPIVRNLTADWFSIDDFYFRMKVNEKTDCRGFWIDSSPMLDTIADCLDMAPDRFRERWNRGCCEVDLKVMGYHCTRYRDQDVFLQRGILPLSNEIVSAFFSEINALLQSCSLTSTAIAELTRSIVRDDKWKHRLSRPGPCFLMSYKEAKIPDNDYHRNGSEIWLLFADYLLRYCREKTIRIPYYNIAALRGIISEALTPFIIHCAIPYSMIPSKDYCTFNILRAFFTFIDPDDDLDDDPKEISGKAIDLNGKILEPKYFIRIETL